MATIESKLGSIQTELKAPKGQYNSFGKYNYRSCEDILEALKPLLVKYEAALILNDKIVQVGDRYYVEATAELIDCTAEGKDLESIAVKAYAREAETKSGMDASQITGAASSYARKYALNGLFAIDDTKDADATNNGADNTTSTKKLICADCGEEITEYKQYSAQQVAEMNAKRYGRCLCAKCSYKQKTKAEQH